VARALLAVHTWHIIEYEWTAARERPLRGLTALLHAVCVSGPESRTGPRESKWGAPLVCDDGVIAKELELEEPVENIPAAR
jgi:chaperonin GroEL